jgi:hypothetical protein
MIRAWRNDAFWCDALLCAVISLIGEEAARHDTLGFGSGLNVVKSSMYGSELQALASLLGFLIAGAAVVAAAPGLNVVKKSNFRLYKRLAEGFRDSMYCAAAACVFMLIAPIFDRRSDNAAIAVVAVGVFLLVVVRLVRAARRLYQTLLA